MFFSVLIANSLMSLALATPTQKVYGCDVSSAQLVLPNSPDISVPRGVKPQYITLGVGTQNYTCSSTGTYASAGAVANLIDISCIYASNPSFFNDAQVYAYEELSAWQGALKPYTYTLGKHYFIAQNGTIFPKFDFTQTGKGYTVAKKVGDIASPAGSQNVDWLELQNTSGTLARYVFRVVTQGGQPPASCTVGQTVTVPYTAKYWFFN
ncbi:unnamed protein product [Rhizoctonia solani]|uniref:Malate dehydrogenase n=1 Tax=Rhizoctonia solani TaxID=456999 RepID=A0A8H3GFJ7_9AGAM|nr:unnamed protein product [Rhizoctonia solani]